MGLAGSIVTSMIISSPFDCSEFPKICSDLTEGAKDRSQTTLPRQFATHSFKERHT